MIINNKIGSVPDLRHVPLGQDHHHQSDWVWPAEPVLAGQQLVVVVAVDLTDPYTDYMVAVAEIDILEGVHYSQVGMAQVDHYYTARESCRGCPPNFIMRRIGRGTERRRNFLYVIGGEEPLLSINPASPPIDIRFSDYFDNIARAEG